MKSRRKRKKSPLSDDPLNELSRYRALGQMIAGFVHQFRTPLHVIHSSSSNLLGSRFLLPATRKELDLILRSAERLQASVSSLLTYAKGDAVPWTENSLNKVVYAICDYLADECRKRGIKLENLLDPRLPVIRMRTEHLEEALLNIAVNAMEATPKNGTIRLKTELTSDGKQAVIRISDQGLGMDPRVLSAKGKPFTTTKKGGMGLGLFFTRKILSQHKAKLAYVSNPPHGTTAIISFPVQPSGHASQ